MIDEKKKEMFIELRSQGKSFDKISAELNVSKPTLIKWSRDFSIDIHNMKSERKDSILEEYQVRSENRLNLLSQNLNKLETELNKRDLSDIPTYKLFDQIRKLHEQIDRIEMNLDFKEDHLSHLQDKWPI